MTTTEFFPTKSAALARIAALGFFEQYDTGESGDHGYGSRLYFKKPGAALSRHGQPFAHAEASKVDREWAVSAFDGPTFIKCPKCEAGKLRVLVHESGKVLQEVELDCVYCGGAGVLTEADVKRIEEQDALWCKCEKSPSSTFHDGPGHYYECDACGGVTQTG